MQNSDACKLDMPCLQGLAAQAKGEQAEGPCKADRRIIKAKRGKQAPTQQVRLLMVCCSLTCWGKLACLLPASANKFCMVLRPSRVPDPSTLTIVGA